MGVAMTTARELQHCLQAGLKDAAGTLQTMVKSPVRFTAPEQVVEAASRPAPTCQCQVAGPGALMLELEFIGRDADALLEALRDLGDIDEEVLRLEILQELGELILSRCGRSLAAALPTMQAVSAVIEPGAASWKLASEFSIPDRQVSGGVCLPVLTH